MTTAENSVSEPPNLKIFWGRIPPDTLRGLCLRHSREYPPLTKILARALYSTFYSMCIEKFFVSGNAKTDQRFEIVSVGNDFFAFLLG